jgi:hypothetical protein
LTPKGMPHRGSQTAIRDHCKAANTVPKRNGGYLTIIPERDVYRLIMRSKLPLAEAFEKRLIHRPTECLTEALRWPYAPLFSTREISAAQHSKCPYTGASRALCGLCGSSDDALSKACLSTHGLRGWKRGKEMRIRPLAGGLWRPRVSVTLGTKRYNIL